MLSLFYDGMRDFEMNAKVKKILGVMLILIGLIALVTPFTPGSWLVFVGLGFFGARLAFWEKILAWLKRFLSK